MSLRLFAYRSHSFIRLYSCFSLFRGALLFAKHLIRCIMLLHLLPAAPWIIVPFFIRSAESQLSLWTVVYLLQVRSVHSSIFSPSSLSLDSFFILFPTFFVSCLLLVVILGSFQCFQSFAVKGNWSVTSQCFYFLYSGNLLGLRYFAASFFSFPSFLKPQKMIFFLWFNVSGYCLCTSCLHYY